MVELLLEKGGIASQEMVKNKRLYTLAAENERGRKASGVPTTCPNYCRSSMGQVIGEDGFGGSFLGKVAIWGAPTPSIFPHTSEGIQTGPCSHLSHL